MELVRATKENGLFGELEAQWKGQLAEFDETLDQYIPAYRQHCHSILERAPDDYYVYLINDNGAYNGFIHINYAPHGIKRLPPPTIRVIEIYLAPIYDYNDITEDKMSDICASLLPSYCAYPTRTW